MDPETFEKEKASITEHGMIDPILVRETPEGWEIVDGFHRWSACTELGHTEILCISLGKASDQQVKKLTIIANDLRGHSDPTKLSHLIADLAKMEPLELLAQTLPMSEKELHSMMSSVAAYDLTVPDPVVLGDDSPGSPKQAQDAQIRLGSVKGTVDAKVFAEFMLEYVAVSKSVGTKNPEIVLAKIAQVLRAVREGADAVVRDGEEAAS